MVRARLYIEGGSRKQKGTRRKAFSKNRSPKEAFQTFFTKAGLQGRLPKIITSGSRENAYDDFCTALEKAGDEDFIVLLVDSEATVTPDTLNCWSHLKQNDGWDKPAKATDDQAHLMVECMEAWFLADPESLEKYFGQNFNAHAIPRGRKIENISKYDLLSEIKSATQKTQKGAYHKGRHSFQILGMLDPELVYNASPHAKQLIDVLRQKL